MSKMQGFAAAGVAVLVGCIAWAAGVAGGVVTGALLGGFAVGLLVGMLVVVPEPEASTFGETTSAIRLPPGGIMGLGRETLPTAPIPSLEELEATMAKEAPPVDIPIAMPGLAAAARQAVSAGALGFLQVIDGANKGHTVMLRGEKIRIGRASENELVLLDDGVSHFHAFVAKEKDGFYAVDLTSRNGTFVNERRVEKHKLKPGDVIGLGATRIFFHTR